MIRIRTYYVLGVCIFLALIAAGVAYAAHFGGYENGAPSYRETWHLSTGTTSNWDGAISNGALVWDNVPYQCHDFRQVSGSSQIYQYKLPIDGQGNAWGEAGYYHDYVTYDADETWHLNVNVHPQGSSLDAWSVAAHELGHILSLAHTANDGPPIPTMYIGGLDYGEYWPRTLEASDRSRIQEIYPGC
jgi:Matrixin